MKKSLVVLLALLLCAPTILHAGDGKPDSVYTSTAQADATARRKAADNPDFLALTFKGLGGYGIELVISEGTSQIDLMWKGKMVDVFMDQNSGPTEDSFKANDKLEWRGLRSADGKFTPYAIIYRIGVVKSSTEKGPTKLVVIKLDGEKSKVLGYTHGANEDADAKKMADAARSE